MKSETASVHYSRHTEVNDYIVKEFSLSKVRRLPLDQIFAPLDRIGRGIIFSTLRAADEKL